MDNKSKFEVPLLDIAASLALASGALYFHGILWSEGVANGVGLPDFIASRDPYVAVLLGFYSLFPALLLNPLGYLVSFSLLFLSLSLRPKRFGTVEIYISIACFVFVNAFVVGIAGIKNGEKYIKEVNEFYEGKVDKLSLTKSVKLTYKDADKRQRTISALSGTDLNTEYVILFTNSSKILLPKSQIVKMEFFNKTEATKAHNKSMLVPR